MKTLYIIEFLLIFLVTVSATVGMYFYFPYIKDRVDSIYSIFTSPVIIVTDEQLPKKFNMTLRQPTYWYYIDTIENPKIVLLERIFNKYEIVDEHNVKGHTKIVNPQMLDMNMDVKCNTNNNCVGTIVNSKWFPPYVEFTTEYGTLIKWYGPFYLKPPNG